MTKIMTPSERKKFFRNKRRTKLSDKDVKGIRKLNRDGKKQKDIAKVYKISAAHVSRILSGEVWSHV